MEPSSSNLKNVATAPGAPVTAIALDPRTRRAISGHTDGSLRVWDIDAASCTAVIQLPGAVDDVAFHADAVQIVAASADRVVRVIDPGSGASHDVASSPSRVLRFISVVRHASRHRALARSFDGHQLRVIDLDHHTAPRELRASVRFGACKLLGDGTTILCAVDDGALQLWRIGGELVRTMAAEMEPSVRLAADARGRYVFAGSTDGRVRGFALDAEAEPFAVRAHSGRCSGSPWTRARGGWPRLGRMDTYGFDAARMGDRLASGRGAGPWSVARSPASCRARSRATGRRRADTVGS